MCCCLQMGGPMAEAVGWAVIVVLPKTGGGRGPSGLIPPPPPILVEGTERHCGTVESAQHARVHVGRCGKVSGLGRMETGSPRRSARVTVGRKSFEQGLLHLARGYEMIPHLVLPRQALRHGYSASVFHLPVAAYRLLRVIRVHATLSRIILAER